MEGIQQLTEDPSLAAREETVAVSGRLGLPNLEAEDKGTLKPLTLASEVLSFKEEIKEAARGGSGTALGINQLKGVKRKFLEAPEGQGFESRHYYTNIATTRERFAEKVVEGSGMRPNDDHEPLRNGENGDGHGSISEKRLKLKSAIITVIEQRSESEGGRGKKRDEKRMIQLYKAEKVQTGVKVGKPMRPTEDKKVKIKTPVNDEFKQKSEVQDRWTGNHHEYMGADFDSSRMTQSRRERERQHKTNGQHCKEHPEEDCSGITRKAKTDFPHSTTDVHEGKNPTLINRDGDFERDGFNWGRRAITKLRIGEDSKTRTDVPKRSREVVDRVRQRGGEVFSEDEDVIRRHKRLPRERIDRFRPGEFEEENFESRWAKQVISEDDKKNGDSRRHGKDSRHNSKSKNGKKSHQHEEDGLTKLRADRRFQFHRLPTTIEKPRSRKKGYFKGNVEHKKHPVANSHQQNAKGIAYGSDERHLQDDQDDQRDAHRSGRRVDHDNSLPCKRAEHDNILPRNERRIDKTSTKDRFVRQPRDSENCPDVVGQSSEDQNASKENVDRASKGTRGTDQPGSIDVTVARHELASSTAVGGSRRSRSSKAIALNQPDEHDMQRITHQNGGKGQRACPEAKQLGSPPQKNSTLDNISKLPNLEVAKNCVKEKSGGILEGLRQMVVEVDRGPEISSKDMLHQSTGKPPTLEKRKRKYRLETSEGCEKLKVTSAHKKESLVSDEGQECKSNPEKQGKDDFRFEGTAKQTSLCTERDVQERMGTDNRAPRQSDEALQLKREKLSTKKKEEADDFLLRRQVVNVDRHKHNVSSQLHKREKHRGRSHSLSPRKHKHFFSPKAHGKSTSPGRSERYKSDWDKFQRERRKTLAAFDSRYRRFGGGTSGLGGYSPRRRRSEAAVKTPSPPPRSPERKKQKAWDSVPPGMDSSMIAAISAAHQAAVQHALATLATVNPLVPSNMLTTPSGTPSVANRLTTVPSMLPSLQPQISPAVTVVTLTQATRPLRRLYVGNVPSTVSDGELLEFMNAAILSANANHLPQTKPCINCSVNVEKNHAFAEFITPEDATAALAFDGVTLHGTTLKIRRPKDFVQPSNGGTESVSRVPDIVSSSVADSPHKVFVGGIPSSLTADKVKEIVTAFGQLKAYHWEVDNNKEPPQAFAFLEYMDPAATVTACAGLNGMRLGTGFLTVVHATPDADSKSASKRAPFYGIPEHAKSLLEPPSCVLELHNLVAAEDVPSMSKEDIEELIEDVRLECTRFGNVKSAHMVLHRSYSDIETGNTPSVCKVNGTTDIGRGDNLDCTKVQESAQENIAQEDSHMALTEGQTEVLEEKSGAAVRLQQGISCDADGKQMLATELADDLSPGHACEATGTNNDGNSCDTANPRNVSEELSNEWEASTSASQMAKIIPFDQHKLVHVQDQGLGALTSDSEQEVDVCMRQWEASHLGKVYVEFSREESACQAAHALHGRLFDGHKVAVGYFPLKLYQERFHKYLGPRSSQEKQALAVALQGHLTAHIKD